MAAAYAALVSLLNTLDQIKIHPLLSTYFNNYPNESLCEKIDFLINFVEKFSSDTESCGEAEDLVRRIAVVAHEAEDIIEVHAADQIRASTTKGRMLKKKTFHRIRALWPKLKKKTVHRVRAFLPKLKKIIDDMDTIKEETIKIKEEIRNRQPTSSMPPAEDPVRRMAVVALEDDEIIQIQPAGPICDAQSLLPDMQNTEEDMDSIKKKVIKTTNVVGFDGYLEQILDRLTGHNTTRQILPIVGMGGIGKTTLAKNVYENSLIVEYFYVRAWITVSQEFSVSEILLQALSCLGRSTSKDDRTNGELGEELYKILCGWRYLMVLDDVWSIQAWEEIMFFFPENNNGSRIVITTRQSDLVGYLGSSAIAVDFLDDKNSWELFCEKTFAQEGCPPELEDVGHKIVRKCKGLPLAIVVAGGLLGKSPRTQEYWEAITKDTRLILDSGEGKFASGILYLSYKHLPVWLKSCFLYLGLFPEDYHIRVSQLIKLWVAEGYIKSNADQKLEEVAENYMKELVDRNLVLVGKCGLNKKFKTCLVHDLVRDMCVRIAEKENVYCVQRDIDGTSHTPSVFHPLIFHGHGAEPFNSRLLRVMCWQDSTPLAFGEVNLRFLIHSTDEIPPSVSLLWSLQTLIITENSGVKAPCEIWEMPQLRHISVKESINLPHPPPSNDVFVLQNLETLERADGLILSKEVCKRIPNIKKLGIRYYWQGHYHLHNVVLLNKLESLQISCSEYEYVGDLFRKLKLPSSLKKLTLKDCKLVRRDVTMLGSLPHLQILKLQYTSVVGAEWNCVKGEFLSLKHLQISRCHDLTYWIADSSSFPVLETLSLKYVTELQEIPSGIGDILTLEKINLYGCSYSAAFSAVKMLEEQESLGNLVLQLHIMFNGKSEAVKLREEMEESDITCQNLLVDCVWDW